MLADLMIAGPVERAAAHRRSRIEGTPLAQSLLDELKQRAADGDVARLRLSRQAIEIPGASRRANYWRGWFDGAYSASSNNAGIGIVLVSPEGICFAACSPVEAQDSTEAEFLALIALLQFAEANRADKLWVEGDSQSVIQMVTGKAVARAHMRGFLRQAWHQRRAFRRATFAWVERAKNGLADRLSKLGAIGLMAAEQVTASGLCSGA